MIHNMYSRHTFAMLLYSMCFSILSMQDTLLAIRQKSATVLQLPMVSNYRSAGLNLSWWLLAHWSKWHSHDDPTMCLSSTSSKAFPAKNSQTKILATERKTAQPAKTGRLLSPPLRKSLWAPYLGRNGVQWVCCLAFPVQLLVNADQKAKKKIPDVLWQVIMGSIDMGWFGNAPTGEEKSTKTGG